MTIAPIVPTSTSQSRVRTAQRAYHCVQRISSAICITSHTTTKAYTCFHDRPSGGGSSVLWSELTAASDL